MAHLLTAHAFPAAYYVRCPACHADLCDPSTGSFMIGRDSLDAFAAQAKVSGLAPNAITCPTCGAVFRLPAEAARVRS
jgi:ribosomal protein S27E